MKWIMLFALLQSPTVIAACSDLSGCKVLQCELERDIAEALRQGHKERAADMQATLDRSRSNCTDAQSTMRSPRDQEAQVQYRQQELQDAQDADNPVKEQKKKMRLDEEMKELEKMRNP